MTTNDALVKYNFIVNIPLKNETSELSKKMKVKVMSMRIELGKIRKEFDADLKEFADSIVTDEMRQLAQVEDKTEEQKAEFEAMNAKVNDEYQAYIAERSQKEVDLKHKAFTEDEYAELIEICAGNDVEINGNKLSPESFLEMIYSIFVNKD